MQPTFQFLPTNEAAATQLQQALGLDPVIARLLVQRGILTPEAATTFFKPRIDGLHHPYLMKDMDKAVERLDAALQTGEKILLYGDYDVDGATSVTMMYSFLSRLTQHLDYYLPDREKEGYGLSAAGVEYARTNGCTLLIAMDCGIKGNESVALANRYQIDVIVCDHHLPEGELPAAVANLDPKRPDCPYPYKELCGCGVAFKLAQALALKYNTPSEELASLLDLVAVAIACDIVPITGENRVLAYFGLQRLNRSPRTGLWALAESVNRTHPLTVQDLVFGLGPAINSAGRLGDARDAVKLMLAADRNSALDAARRLAQRNAERRRVDYATADEARRRFRDTEGWEDKKSIVLFDPGWHKGIIGISASRIAEDFHKPTVILTESNGRAVGSARSVKGFDLYAALQACDDLFYSFGGHAHAAGMQMPVENVPKFRERFELVVEKTIPKSLEKPMIDIAAIVRFDEITPKFWNELQRFEPFGPSNLSPVFVAQNVQNTGYSKLLENNHARLSLRQHPNGPIFNGVAFGLGDVFMQVKDQPFNVAFTLHENSWKGEKKLELMIKGIEAV
ncbi:MAG: single-stranded-DNA-specific exonuclease RecJ [Saprospiraceae bacterium]|nr:single-stranded-DNA-specific exonuclease RecJ [Saprospiraceae bacterium]